MELKPTTSQKIKTVIVEDERKSLLTLEALLERFCPEVEMIGSARSVNEGIELLSTVQPDLVFMDIAMPDGDAFELLRRLGKVEFEVIFITAYNDYALKAFEFSALHYLLKPINYQDLQMAVDRFIKIRPKNNISARLEILNQSLHNQFIKISLPTNEGLTVVEINDIIRIEASSNYSIFYLTNQDQLVAAKSLSQFEDILMDIGFVRIHHTHMINMRYVKKYQKGRGGLVTMTDGSSISVSAARKKEFLDHLNGVSLNLGDVHS